MNSQSWWAPRGSRSHVGQTEPANNRTAATVVLAGSSASASTAYFARLPVQLWRPSTRVDRRHDGGALAVDLGQGRDLATIDATPE